MKYVPRCATEHVRVGPGSVSALLLVLSIASGCVATTPTESSTTTAAPATATKSTATQSTASTTRRKKPATSTAKAPSTKTPEQQDVVASIAQGVTAALLGEPLASNQTTATASAPTRGTTSRKPATTTRSRPPTSKSTTTASPKPTTPKSTTTTSRSRPSTTTRARQPATTVATTTGSAARAAQPRADTVMTDFGEVWVDESCSWAEVDGLAGEIYDVDGELWIIDENDDYLALVPDVAQCRDFLQTAALPVETAAEPVPEWLEEEPAEEQLPEWLEEEPAQEPVPEWLQAEAQTDMEVSGADAGGIWIDDNCEWAEVNGFTGYVAEDAGQLFIFSEAGEYLADVPPGLFPQCGY